MIRCFNLEAWEVACEVGQLVAKHQHHFAKPERTTYLLYPFLKYLIMMPRVPEVIYEFMNS